MNRLVDTTEESITASMKLQDLDFSMMCACGSWRFSHVVTDDYAYNKRMKKLLDDGSMEHERLSVRNPSILGGVSESSHILFCNWNLETFPAHAKRLLVADSLCELHVCA